MKSRDELIDEIAWQADTWSRAELTKYSIKKRISELKYKTDEQLRIEYNRLFNEKLNISDIKVFEENVDSHAGNCNESRPEAGSCNCK